LAKPHTVWKRTTSLTSRRLHVRTQPWAVETHRLGQGTRQCGYMGASNKLAGVPRRRRLPTHIRRQTPHGLEPSLEDLIYVYSQAGNITLFPPPLLRLLSGWSVFTTSDRVRIPRFPLPLHRNCHESVNLGRCLLSLSTTFVRSLRMRVAEEIL
jgi:hypothetical protein